MVSSVPVFLGTLGGIRHFTFRMLAKMKETPMASSAKRKYSPSAGDDVKREMDRYKRGTARSGPGGKGGKVKSRKQAIAIGLSKARKKGKKAPMKP